MMQTDYEKLLASITEEKMPVDVKPFRFTLSKSESLEGSTDYDDNK